MNETFKSYLQKVQRLGKVERAALRAALIDSQSRIQFVNLVTGLIEKADASDEAVLEDIFIFGVQVADLWPEDEIRFEFSKIDQSVLAFRSGFSGDNFTTVFSKEALAELERQATDSPGLPSASTTSKVTSGAGSKPHKKHQRKTHSIELQKHHLAA